MINLLYIFIFGLIIGSFLTMLTYRLPKGLSLLGRSFCDNCKEKISWKQNIPLFYFIYTGGRSKCCKRKISFRYPLIEIATAVFFVFSFWLFKQNEILNPVAIYWKLSLGVIYFPVFLLLLGIFIALTIIDIEHGILPDILLKVLFIPIIFFLFVNHTLLFSHLLWGLLAFIFFLFIYMITNQKGMGFGDVKLVFLLGILLGFPAITSSLFLSFLLGSVVGLILILGRRFKFGRPIAFGPFLLFCAWVSFFLGDTLLVYYLDLLANI